MKTLLITSLSKMLSSRGQIHIADHTRASRIITTLKVAQNYFKATNYVPGFPDIVCVTSKKKCSEVRRIWKPLRWSSFSHFDLHVGFPGAIPKIKPDILWIDDINLRESEIKKLRIKFSLCPTIYSGASAGSKQMVVIVDTREQKPLWEGIQVKCMKLEVGDYTTEKLFNKFHIERKSMQDLYGTITKGHVRFRNELIRADDNDVRLAMYVEGSKKNFITKNFPGGSRLEYPETGLEKIVNTIEKRYKLEVVWGGSRNKTKNLVFKRLKQEEQKHGRNKS